MLRNSLVILTIISIANLWPVDARSNLLKGVIMRNWPYADQFGDQYEGFAVDLIDLIAERVGFEYCLHQPRDGRYGQVRPDGTVNGMIGEVYTSEADFAAGDLEITDERRKYVDFTVPYVENQLAAIIRKDMIDNPQQPQRQQPPSSNRTSKYSSLQDLVQASGQQQQPIVFGVLRNSAIYNYLSRSTNPIAQQIYRSIMDNQNQNSLVNNANEGVSNVYRNPNYVFLVESTFAEDVIGQNCNLTMVIDKQSMYPRNFAIALIRGSPYLQRFNQAIQELKSRGQIELLRQKYWTKFCDQQGRLRDYNIDQRLPSPPMTPPQTPAYNGGPYDPYSNQQQPRWPSQVGQQQQQDSNRQPTQPEQIPRHQYPYYSQPQQQSTTQQNQYPNSADSRPYGYPYQYGNDNSNDPRYRQSQQYQPGQLDYSSYSPPSPSSSSSMNNQTDDQPQPLQRYPPQYPQTPQYPLPNQRYPTTTGQQQQAQSQQQPQQQFNRTNDTRRYQELSNQV